MNVINKERLENVCKVATGECCRYITAGYNGIRCAKHTDLRQLLDEKVANGQMVATGDNCEGL